MCADLPLSPGAVNGWTELGSVEAYVAFSALCQAFHVFKSAAPPPLSNLVAKSSTILSTGSGRYLTAQITYPCQSLFVYFHEDFEGLLH